MTGFMASNGFPAPPEQVDRDEDNLFPHTADRRRGGACTECLKVPINQLATRKRTAASGQCQHCQHPMCKTHRIQVCLECSGKLMFRPDAYDPDVDD